MTNTDTRTVRFTMDPVTWSRIRVYALQHGTPVSALVAGYLSLLADDPETALAKAITTVDPDPAEMTRQREAWTLAQFGATAGGPSV